MRSGPMQRLDALTGTWRTTMHDAWFLEPAEQPVVGTTTIEWWHDAFVLCRWTTPGDGAAGSAMSLALGHHDVLDAYTALYHDERGVSRVFAMDFGDGRWTLNREDDDMFQRFVAEVAPDRITGRWQASDDGGTTWRTDFVLDLARTD
ncbi:hypothetical protein [Isoptericola sp. AK164]|uniref:hypothetical protein n=1 Tax=Isoptericola sp. AK164 TaxID=3024246 RepID=UPI0024184E7D|nr:hypothetical protein [Isoptericola sp. AK164]